MIWIEKKYKKEYNDSAKATGIRIKYDVSLSEDLILQYSKFVRYLRKKYYFPIRVNIKLCNVIKFKNLEDGHFYYGIFYDGENNIKRKIYPRMAVASKIDDSNLIEDVLFTLVHELTHYYQWYFCQEESRTDRSLEIEANKYADYILYEYFNQ